MHIPTVIGSLALMVNSALAADIIINNKCHYPVWVSTVQKEATPLKKIQPGDNWSEAQKPALDGVGVSIQVIKQDAFSEKPILNLQYSLNGEDLWYSMSNTPSDPNALAFKDEKLRIHNTDGLLFTEIVWVGNHRPEGTEHYHGEATLTLELCDDFARRFRAQNGDDGWAWWCR
ncbi:hypothetical protein J4E90_008915 [Alternaria incomplexa]|uniref:uncharacterized protein n=2 Tax=Alternaria sect. Infectoriae TaxID=2499258 RepID=UPI00221EE587|nr:uncharacterized protein J4E90_008915 [Alternaria incomplexa]KAI4908291.1 hypothetical protein J4E90_008915 [Alternaria incomplexa]